MYEWKEGKNERMSECMRCMDELDANVHKRQHTEEQQGECA